MRAIAAGNGGWAWRQRSSHPVRRVDGQHAQAVGQDLSCGHHEREARGTHVGRKSGVSEETLRLIRALRSSGLSWQKIADALTEEGYLVPLARPGEALRYEANLDGHLHMVCRKCNRFFDIVHPLPDLLSEVKAKYPAFVIEDVQVEYQGLCPACQAATAK